jgi:uncharacterized membrane protein (TIGR02234 family)
VSTVESSPAGGSDTRRSRRERLVAATAVALGAGLMLLAVSRTWAHAILQDPLVGRLSVDASGRDAAPAVAAVALVALAGAVAVLTLRTIGRFVAGVLLVVSGAAALGAAVDVVRTPSDALRSVVSGATGRTGGAPPVAQQTAWPWVAVAGAVLVLVGGALAVARARRWSGLSGRYDAPVGPASSARPEQVPDGAGDGVVPALHTGRREDGLADDTLEQTADEVPDVDPWDQLSRGEDPTA